MSPPELERITVTALARMQAAGEKIACLTAYDASFAVLLDGAGVDVVLVGDTLGMVVQGHTTTVPVSVDDMVYHTRAVARGLRRALLIADMPFMSYRDTAHALANAARLMQSGGAHMVKIEGGRAQPEIVSALADQGVPVCAHLGLQPQTVHRLGGFRVQGREEASAEALQSAAQAVQTAGAQLLLLECVPAALAARITAEATIPVIGIGAGVDCDGQILVLYDALGITPGTPPRFTRDFMAGAGSVADAVRGYVDAVKRQRFPAPEHSF